jgi:diguanylate cyclase (GGDEF)-like protein/PAS domain S-box-containing protein
LENKLRETAERYSWLFEDSPLAMYICDADGCVLEVNTALCNLLRCPREDVVGQTMGGFSVDAALAVTELEPFLSGKARTYSCLRRYRASDGRVLHARVTLGAVRDASGRARTIFGEIEDLTPQYLAGEEIDRQRRRVQMAIEASDIAVWELDTVSGVVTVQDHVSGAARARQQTMTYGDFVRSFHPDDRCLLPTIKALRDHTCGELDVELRAGPPQASPRWARVKGRAVPGHDGSVARVAGTTADVTEHRLQRAELAAERDRLMIALETAGMMAWEIDFSPPPGKFRAVHADLLDLDVPAGGLETSLGACPVFGDRVFLADREALDEAVRRALDGPDEVVDLEYRWLDDLGVLRWVHTRARAERGASGLAVRMSGTTADVTAARRELAARLRAETILSRTLEASQDAFIGVNQLGIVTDWNPAAEAMFGWFRDEAVGESLACRIFGGDEEVLRGVLAGLGVPGTEGVEGSVRREIEARTRDGRHFPIEASVVRVEDDGVPLYRLFARDLSERKAYEGQLVRHALFDPLTGLPNRALLVDRLRGAIGRLSRLAGLVAVLFIDVDRFKIVNDSLGHRSGDDFLVQLAGRLRSVLRPADTVARFGGDEFVVLCETSGSETEAMALAERVQGVFAKPFALAGHPGREIYASASVGIALATGPATTAEVLVRDAGTAMHRAKEQGGGRAEVFDAESRRRSVAHLETESELRRALERSELRVYYQPVVDLTGRLKEVEALVRWAHPSGRVALPAEFVPLAEETGLIVSVGEAVLRMACRQAAQWRNEHTELADMRLAVNVSSAQLRSHDAVERIMSVLEGAALPPEALVLEITESVLMDERTGAGSKLAALRSLGVRLAMDDFGTGYSSLLYLRRYPLDMLKIDRSFVAGLVDNTEDAAIVDAVVRLGHSFGLQTVAEGVETIDQLTLLSNLECDMGQGYFWGRPMPPERLLSQVLPQPPGSAVER